MVRVVIHAATITSRLGLEALVRGNEAFQVVGQSAYLVELQDAIANADVLIELQDTVTAGSTSQSTELITRTPPGCAVLFIGLSLPFDRNNIPVNRVWGNLPYEFTREELEAAIQALAAGLVVMSPQVAFYRGSVEQKVEEGSFENGRGFTNREVEVLNLLAGGLANKQIAERLGISPNTVKFHLATLYEKLEATNRAEAVSRAMKKGIISL